MRPNPAADEARQSLTRLGYQLRDAVAAPLAALKTALEAHYPGGADYRTMTADDLADPARHASAQVHLTLQDELFEPLSKVGHILAACERRCNMGSPEKRRNTAADMVRLLANGARLGQPEGMVLQEDVAAAIHAVQAALQPMVGIMRAVQLPAETAAGHGR